MSYVSPYDSNEVNASQNGHSPNVSPDQIANMPNIGNAALPAIQYIDQTDKTEQHTALPRHSTIITKSAIYDSIDPEKWREPLYNRGFTDQQIQYFNIRPGTTIFHDPVPGETVKDFEIVDEHPANSIGWIYPIYYPQSNVSVNRIKYFPGRNDRSKVLSPKGFRMPGGKHPPFYVPHKDGLDRLRKAIAANNGVLFGVEGEPDNWAMDVMGIYNVTAFFGWTNVPESLAASLKWLGVRRFIYITDNDEGGTRGAHNVWNALYYTDISYVIYQTPTTYNGTPTKDTNDVLKAIQYNPQEFGKYLNEVLPGNHRLVFDQPSRGKFEGFAENKESYGIYDTNAMTKDAIEILNSVNKTAITQFDDNGWSNNTQCPVTKHENDDKKPSFGINIHGGAGNCFKCGSHSIVTICKSLGMDVDQYRLDRKEPTPPPDGMNRLEKVTYDNDYQMVGSFFTVARAQGAAVDYVNSDPSLYVRPRRQVMQDIIKRAEGTYDNYLTYSVPWPMDDPQFTKLGGYCTALPAGKLVQIISYSGGGKTTFARSLEYAFNEVGVNTLLWSPEFDDMEHGDSSVQLLSGVSSIAAMKNDQFYIDRMNNVDTSEFGEVFDEFERIKTKEAAQKLIDLPGESYLATQFNTDVYSMLMMFEAICDYALSEGNEIQVVFVDYAQLMQSPQGERDWDLNKSVLAFKQWCNLHGPYVSPRDGVTRMRRRKIGIFTSQATKESTKAVQTGEQPYLTPEDAMVVRPDWSNLILSTKMGGNFSYNPEWGHSREYEIYVCKNSKGDKREFTGNETGPVKMILNLKNLRVMYHSERLMKQKEKERERSGYNPQPKPRQGYMVDENGEILPIPKKETEVPQPPTQGYINSAAAGEAINMYE